MLILTSPSMLKKPFTACVQNQMVICIDHQVFPPGSFIQLKVRTFKKILMIIGYKNGLKSNCVGTFLYHLGRVLNIPVRLQRLAFLFLFLRSREQDEQ